MSCLLLIPTLTAYLAGSIKTPKKPSLMTLGNRGTMLVSREHSILVTER